MREGTKLELFTGFAGACRLFRIQPVEALQFFVSNVTLYAHLAGNCETIGAMANTVFNHYLQKTKRKTVLEKRYKYIMELEYVQQIMRMIRSRGTYRKKFQKYTSIVENWYAEIHKRLRPETIRISKEKLLMLPADFQVLCDLLQCDCMKVIQHYINHVSLEKYFYSKEEYIYTSATSFFLQYPPVKWQVRVG